ncbi:MAG TPA: glycerol-3-phosphate dehydrogenase/oxidase [Streptosporangiaceae bacterium]
MARSDAGRQADAMTGMALSPEHRAASLRRMATETFDILVVGGGVTGAGAALDAATRGLTVALIEARDYAAGASSKSSKLIHGGLRYLEMLDFGLVREALTERGLLLTRLAPHLVKPVPFLWPLTHRVWERPYVGAGLVLYDTMGGRRAVPRARHLSKTGALRLAPALRPDALVGGVQFYDAQEDDARMVACLARTAAGYGAVLATGVRMDGTLADSGRVTGVRARDLMAGTDLRISARHVVLATGAWTSAAAGQDLRVRPSKGVHIVVPRDRIAMDTGLLTRTEKSVLFVIPWGDHWLIGDTDTEWPYDPAHPAASRADIEYLLAKVNHLLREPLTADDIEGVFAGLRPLVAAGAGSDTTRLSREHSVDSSVPGLSVIAGGKYTTYRVMARDLIDTAAADLAAVSGVPSVPVPASRTDQVPLSGAEGYHRLWAARQQIAEAAGLAVGQIERLLGRYGSDVTDLLELIAARPDAGEVVPGSGGYLGAEIVYACTHEGALRLDDVLSRRTRITIETRDRGLGAAPHAAVLMAPELGWDEIRTAAEVTRYQEMIAADLAAEAMPDDRSAYEASGSGFGPPSC